MSTLALILGFLAFANASIIQDKRLSLNQKNVNFKTFFQLIESQTDYFILFNEDIIKENQNISFDLYYKNSDLTSILDDVLKKHGLTYTVSDLQIIIDKDSSKGADSNGRNSLMRRAEIVGKIVDQLGEGIPGVTVMVKGTQRGVVTDIDGNFRLQTNEGEVLVIRSVGYVTQEIAIRNQSNIEITLQESVGDLSEFVVTGYSVQEKRVITGAISSVQKEQIENMPVASFDRAIQGQLSGVNIMGASGVPGGPVRINVRGQGSITAGNDPLIIVDGVQLNSDLVSGLTASNPLAFLNPNDIESIEVLKDAAAASIYGAQAANGVILVTTKKGKSGKTQYTLNYYHGITAPMPELPMLNSQEYLDVRFEARNNRYPTRTELRNRQDILSASGLPLDLTDEQIANLPTYNWQNEVFQTGRLNNIELSASGGNNKTTFFLSGSYNKTDGNVIGVDFQRATAKLSMTHKENERLSFGFNVNFANIIQNGPSGSDGSTGNLAAPQYTGPAILPFIPIYNEDGTRNAPIEGFPGSSNRNPIHETLVNELTSNTKSAIANFNIDYSFTDKLTFRSFYGLDYRVIDDRRYVDPQTRSGVASQGSLSVGFRQNTNFITNQTLRYSNTYNDLHNLSLLAGAEYRSDVAERTSVSATGFSTSQFRTIQSAAVITGASGSWTGFKRVGMFGQANYDFDKKYMVSAILRYDGSSRFGENNKFGFFPALSAGWDIKQESFMLDNHWLDQLKIRVGYGQTGNDAIGNFSSRGLYSGSSSSNYNNEPGIFPISIANTDLRWERNVTTNIGLDYSLWSGRVSGSVELFRRDSRDLLLDRPLPQYSGFSLVTSNVGAVRNEGLEIAVNTVNINSGNFYWKTNFNITFIRNEVLRLFDDEQVLPGNQSVRVGYPLRTNVDYAYAGVNSATGRPMWYDGNNNITYNPVAPNDLFVFGNELSSHFGGLTNEFKYKGITFTTLFIYDFGRQFENGANSRLWRNGDDDRNTLAFLYHQRWTEPGQITAVPRPIHGGSEPNGRSHSSSSSRFLEDASFIRLKQLSVSYDFPKSITNKMKVNGLRLYGQGVNLLTWTKWTGYDPELIINEGNFSSARGVIPQTRAYTLGFQLLF
ncbi:SusC/RagA family TonB-linked outer membrane protein [Belliella kenyensis]|uniref:SusC/RagA family TonB-linked outer membrane protein n=1 Tax=Belliella kenyensis TaxID=1472724 RepID=A0ABV8EJ83_9BACT|nr:TonB-dependent receptor [Belliella kenyensis]MCH7401430.1 TonB-dependent receptor [Belliella kenyensis]MDN3602873.1 TonB-dependent receptor [Belliella kenyensis]